MAVSAFRSILIFNYSISDIFIIFLIIYIGIKYGSSFGGITGLAIGASLTLISNVELFQICVFIISGILSGILGHILMPDRFRRKAFNSEMLLGNSSEHRLNYYEEIKEKISAVAKTISDMNSNFFVKNDEEDIFNKEEYIDNFLNLIENYPENIFYDDVINNEELIGDFFDYLTKEDVITEKVTIEIFKKYHNYILLRDQKLKDDLQELIKIANRVYHELQLNSVKMRVKREEASKLENQLKNVTNIITSISKDEKEDKFENKEKEINTLLRGKACPVKNVKVDMCENGKYLVTLSFEQFNESIREKNKITNIEILISRSLNVKCSFQKDKKILSTGEYTQVYSADDKFALQVGNSKISKDGTGKPSGDSNLQIRLNDGKYLLAISDGMGNGKKAQDASKFVINTLNTLLSNGFEKNETIQLINSELNFNKDDEMYATIDMSILDLYNGKILISKNGACNTYIKNKRSISVYKGNNLPVGIIQETSLNNQEADLNEGDIILMCSDGLIACKNEMKADWIEEFLKNIDTNNVQKIADLITNEAIDNSFGVPQDDITVIVAKIIKKK